MTPQQCCIYNHSWRYMFLVRTHWQDGIIIYCTSWGYRCLLRQTGIFRSLNTWSKHQDGLHVLLCNYVNLITKIILRCGSQAELNKHERKQIFENLHYCRFSCLCCCKLLGNCGIITSIVTKLACYFLLGNHNWLLLYCFIENKDMESSRQNDLVYFTTRDELIRVHLDDVIYFESNGNYIKMVGIGNIVSNLLTSMTSLTEVFKAIDDVKFVRVGKSHYINTKQLYQINIMHKQLLLRDSPGLPLISLPVSKKSLRDLKQSICEQSLVVIEDFKTHNGKMLAFHEKENISYTIRATL